MHANISTWLILRDDEIVGEKDRLEFRFYGVETLRTAIYFRQQLSR